jgi:hypothetical protein
MALLMSNVALYGELILYANAILQLAAIVSTAF